MTQAKPAVTSLQRVTMIVVDLDAAEHFFSEAFAFEPIARGSEDAAFSALLGVPDAKAVQTIMRLGEQEIGLLCFDPPGHPYPAGSTSTDLWFQHFAIIVSDMDAAYRRLQNVGRFSPISEDGPQLLPPSSGGVTAFKFRDIEGHPLELLAFPPGEGPAIWQEKAANALFLGIDHSAIAVADTGRSVAFYQNALGLSFGEQTENRGPEQSRMDAVPDAVVTVTGLNPATVATPHVELLGYKVGSRRAIASETCSNDIAATLFVLRTNRLADLVENLTAAEARFISPGIVALANDEQAIAILDPDGHRIVVMQ